MKARSAQQEGKECTFITRTALTGSSHCAGFDGVEKMKIVYNVPHLTYLLWLLRHLTHKMPADTNILAIQAHQAIYDLKIL